MNMKTYSRVIERASWEKKTENKSMANEKRNLPYFAIDHQTFLWGYLEDNAGHAVTFECCV